MSRWLGARLFRLGRWLTIVGIQLTKGVSHVDARAMLIVAESRAFNRLPFEDRVTLQAHAAAREPQP